MSSFDRRAVVLGALAAAGCGFTPVYGPEGSAGALRGAFSFDPPADTDGFQLVRALERRLGSAEAPRYRFSASLAIEDEGAGITQDQVITRFRVLGRADFTVTDLATGARLTSGTVSNFTGYSATSTTVATRSVAQDARERLMVVLADQIVARLLVTSGEWAA